MYLAIIIMPLLGSVLSGFFGRKIGVKGSHLVTCSLVVCTTLLAIMAFAETGLTNIPVSFYLFRWVDSESLNVFWGFNFDSLTVSMLIPVLIVSSLVHLYSIGYMSHDPHNQRFFSYLSLFTFMMIILVTANNYLLMFVGWEGVGICSYLLVSFWFTRIAANQSSIAAILTNRVGDCFLTIGMFAILWSLGNLDYASVFSLAPFVNENIVTFIGICLLIGAMAKSSQVGLHIWLPMAMEGPTPVSALIHAATMVTAGVYLLIRSSPLIEYSTAVLLLCLWVGAITTVFSSLIGLFQQDIKKVIAYSTMSQLGLMVVAVGLSSYNVALFHLINHAFYKALLFLGAGAVIHAVADNQDFRKYGGLKQFLPLSYSVMFIASLSLVAFPFMTGFYSKDFILESAYGQYHLSSIIVYYIATIGAMFTTLYSVKTLYLTFITNPNGSLIDYKNVHEGDIYMSLPLVILALFSIFFGFITKDMFIGLGSDLFTDNAIFIHPMNEIMLNTEFAVPTMYKLLPLLFTVSLTVMSIVISEYLVNSLMGFKFSRIGYNIFSFFNLRFLIELVYNKYVTEIVLKLGGQTTKVLDRGAIELLGPYGMQKTLYSISKLVNTLSTGVVTTYALYILVSGMFYVIISYMSLFSSSFIILLILSLSNDLSTNTSPTKNTLILKSSSVSMILLNIDLITSLTNLIHLYTNKYISKFNLNELIIRVAQFRVTCIYIAAVGVATLDTCCFYLYSTEHIITISLVIYTAGLVGLFLIGKNLIYVPWRTETVLPVGITYIFNITIVSLLLCILAICWNTLTTLDLSMGFMLGMITFDSFTFINGPESSGNPYEGGNDPSKPTPPNPNEDPNAAVLGKHPRNEDNDESNKSKKVKGKESITEKAKAKGKAPMSEKAKGKAPITEKAKAKGKAPMSEKAKGKAPMSEKAKGKLPITEKAKAKGKAPVSEKAKGKLLLSDEALAFLPTYKLDIGKPSSGGLKPYVAPPTLVECSEDWQNELANKVANKTLIIIEQDKSIQKDIQDGKISHRTAFFEELIKQKAIQAFNDTNKAIAKSRSAGGVEFLDWRDEIKPVPRMDTLNRHLHILLNLAKDSNKTLQDYSVYEKVMKDKIAGEIKRAELRNVWTAGTK